MCALQSPSTIFPTVCFKSVRLFYRFLCASFFALFRLKGSKKTASNLHNFCDTDRPHALVNVLKSAAAVAF